MATNYKIIHFMDELIKHLVILKYILMNAFIEKLMKVYDL